MGGCGLIHSHTEIERRGRMMTARCSCHVRSFVPVTCLPRYVSTTVPREGGRRNTVIHYAVPRIKRKIPECIRFSCKILRARRIVPIVAKGTPSLFLWPHQQQEEYHPSRGPSSMTRDDSTPRRRPEPNSTRGGVCVCVLCVCTGRLFLMYCVCTGGCSSVCVCK